MRAESIKSILNKWVALRQVWDKSLDGNLDPEIKGRIIGVKIQMNTFNYLYGVTILQLVLRHYYYIYYNYITIVFSDNLSKTLQKSSLIFCQGKEIADLTLQTINSLRSESEFELLWQETVQHTTRY